MVMNNQNYNKYKNLIKKCLELNWAAHLTLTKNNEIIYYGRFKTEISLLEELPMKFYFLPRELNPFQPIVLFYKEASHLIFNANQMTGFYMK